MSEEDLPKISEICILDDKKKSKYHKQIEYDKKRKQEDPEYKKKKNELVRVRNAERYKTDPEYRQKIIDASKVRNRKILDIYKENKELFKSLSMN
jgi:hypothetical protein